MRQFLLLALLFLHYSLFVDVATGTSYLEEIPVTCPETWIIDNETYLTNGTWISGRKLFSVKIFSDVKPGTDLTLKEKAKNIAIFALKNGFFHNSLKFNLLNSSFSIEKRISVSFVQGDYDEVLDEKPETFNFDIENLNVNNIEKIKLPHSLTPKEINSLESKLRVSYSKADFKAIYNLLGPRAKSQVPFEEILKSSKHLKDVIGDVKDVKFHDFIYIGDKDGIKGYEVLFDVKYHNRFLKKVTEGRIILTIIDHEPVYEIYEVKFVVNKNL